MEEGFKRIVELVESVAGQHDKDVVDQALKQIITTCEELLVTDSSPTDIDQDPKMHDEIITVENSNITFDRINVIDFVYKPIYKKDYFEGDYIIRFAEERTQDLKLANALDVHNKFWIQHKTLTGSIFGSVPMELLDKDAISTLFNRGWIDTKVEIYEILNSDDVKEITDVCKAKFDKYILVKEELTNAYLVLYYL